MNSYLAFILILFINPLYVYADADAEKSVCTTHHCIAVIDAGSSGSRLHIYTYELDKTNTPIQINEIWKKKAAPGLSRIEHEHRSISVYMEQLFEDAPVASMPVYFYSTAGMRLLSKRHQNNINQLVSEWFAKQYYWRLVSARTISGGEEGLFAWLATNYKLNLLDQSSKPTVGVIEIGGASVQIAFPIKNESGVGAYDKVTVELYGKRHVLFSHSFLGLGQNEMGHQYIDKKSCFPDNFELSDGRPAKGDAYTCRNELSILVNSVHSVNKIVDTPLSLNPVDRWYLAGGLVHMLNDKMFPSNNQSFNNKNLTAFVDKKICHQKWLNLEEMYPNNHAIFNYCLMTAFLNALLKNGYGIPTTKNIYFMPLDKPIDWTLGVVLHHKQT